MRTWQATFPVSEEASNGLLMLSSQYFGIIFVFLLQCVRLVAATAHGLPLCRPQPALAVAPVRLAAATV